MDVVGLVGLVDVACVVEQVDVDARVGVPLLQQLHLGDCIARCTLCGIVYSQGWCTSSQLSSWGKSLDDGICSGDRICIFRM